MEEKLKEVTLLLGVIRQYNPALYRHLVGMIRELASLQVKK